MKEKIYNGAKEIFALVFGALLFAVSLNMFLRPAEVVQGGVTGIATTVNILFGVDMGLTMVVCNIPLILLSAKVYGLRFIAKGAVGVMVTSIFTDILAYMPSDLFTVDDPFLCALFGGITMGMGCGIMFTRGYTTGGTDLVAFLIKKVRPALSIGRLVLICDSVIIIGAAAVLQNWIGILYSALTIFIQSTVVDLILNGADRTKLFLVITEKGEAVSAALASLNRGVTLLKGQGYHTERDKTVIMCVVKPRQVYSARTAINSADPAAFTVVADCSQTYGQGFTE